LLSFVDRLFAPPWTTAGGAAQQHEVTVHRAQLIIDRLVNAAVLT